MVSSTVGMFTTGKKTVADIHCGGLLASDRKQYGLVTELLQGLTTVRMQLLVTNRSGGSMCRKSGRKKNPPTACFFSAQF